MIFPIIITIFTVYITTMTIILIIITMMMMMIRKRTVFHQLASLPSDCSSIRCKPSSTLHYHHRHHHLGDCPNHHHIQVFTKIAALSGANRQPCIINIVFIIVTFIIIVIIFIIIIIFNYAGPSNITMYTHPQLFFHWCSMIFDNLPLISINPPSSESQFAAKI